MTPRRYCWFLNKCFGANFNSANVIDDPKNNSAEWYPNIAACFYTNASVIVIANFNSSNAIDAKDNRSVYDA